MPDVPTRLNQLLADAGHPPLPPETGEKFLVYLTLLERWNAKTNLTAIRDREGILSRHFLESILCAKALPPGIATLLDFGSGAGFPGIPITLMRNDLAVTLAESQNKKAAFLREAVRILELTATVHSARAETLSKRFDCITLRAVDQMERALPTAVQLLTPTGYLALLTTVEDAALLQTVAAASTHFHWFAPHPLPQTTNRMLLLGHLEL